MSPLKRKDDREQKEFFELSNGPPKLKKKKNSKSFHLNREIYYEYLAEIQNFSPTLTEIALIHRIKSFFLDVFPCSEKELQYILIYIFKIFRKTPKISLPKLMNVSRNERFSWIESISKLLSKIFCEIFISDQSISEIKYINKKVQDYFTRYF